MTARQTFSPAQCRAARGLLDWSQDVLAVVARLEPEAVELYERGEGMLSTPDLVQLGAAFNNVGVIAVAEYRAGEGVRFNRARSPLARTGFAED